jgi:hypothetical protein
MLRGLWLKSEKGSILLGKVGNHSPCLPSIPFSPLLSPSLSFSLLLSPCLPSIPFSPLLYLALIHVTRTLDEVGKGRETGHDAEDLLPFSPLYSLLSLLSFSLPSSFLSLLSSSIPFSPFFYLALIHVTRALVEVGKGRETGHDAENLSGVEFLVRRDAWFHTLARYGNVHVHLKINK